MAREAVCPKRGRVVAGGHPMRRIVVGSLVALASVVLAGRALADDLYATVEKTTAPGTQTGAAAGAEHALSSSAGLPAARSPVACEHQTPCGPRSSTRAPVGKLDHARAAGVTQTGLPASPEPAR